MLIGNLGKDPEIRVSQIGGRKSVSFSIATSRRYRDNNGEQKEDTQWHNIVGWGKIADVIEQLQVRKGTTLYVEGRLTNRSWTDQASGQKRYVTEVALDTFQLLTPRGTQNGNNGNGYGAQGQQQRPAYQNEYDQQQADDCEDLPF